MKHSRVPAPLKKLVVATANAGKLRELRVILRSLPFEVVGQSALGVASAEETGASFLANALLKARHASAATGAAALADDSGLEVDALGGAPGIHSARYAGIQADAAANNAKLLAALEGLRGSARSARYRCALVYVDGPRDPAPLTAQGVWEGYVLDAPRGCGGFGYDPYFFVPELDRTAAELDPAEKNRLSHRGKALAAIVSQLEARA
jgi:XTP/dITP diphosphohydrolase